MAGVNVSGDLKLKMIVGGSVALCALILFFKYKKSVADAFNPMSEDNLINQGVQSVYQAVTGSTGSIGTDLYDVLHDEKGKNVVAKAVNPVDDENLIYRWNNFVWQKATGSTGSIGSDLYDLFN